MRGQKHRDGHDDRDEQRIKKREFALFLQHNAEAVSRQAHRNAEEDGLFKKAHFCSAPFFPLRSTPCVTRPETPITTMVVTTAMTI